MRTPFTSIFLFLTVIGTAIAQLPPPEYELAQELCNQQKAKKLEFLVDGSFQDERILKTEIAKLKNCGVDDFDVSFFGRMDAMTSMLRKLTKEKSIERLTFADLMMEIDKMKQTEAYQKIKSITELSDLLASRVGSLSNWKEDIKIFQELGASKTVISKVYEYLEAHPKNTKTYQEILESLK